MSVYYLPSTKLDPLGVPALKRPYCVSAKWPRTQIIIGKRGWTLFLLKLITLMY